MCHGLGQGLREDGTRGGLALGNLLRFPSQDPAKCSDLLRVCEAARGEWVPFGAFVHDDGDSGGQPFFRFASSNWR